MTDEHLSYYSTFSAQTPVEEVPAAIAPFQGRVLIGVGKLLRVYDLGKKKLLRKCENKVLALSSGDRGEERGTEFLEAKLGRCNKLLRPAGGALAISAVSLYLVSARQSLFLTLEAI